MEHQQQREAAAQLAKRDFAAARAVARGIEDPWYRAQALAWAARYAAEEDVLSIAREALDAAAECQAPYQSVAAAAWPIAALMERGKREAAGRELDRLIALLPHVQPASSRSEALFLLFQAAFQLGDDMTTRLARLLLAIHEGSGHWRARRNLVDALAMLSGQDATSARALVESISDDRARRKAERALDAHTPREPRPFFW